MSNVDTAATDSKTKRKVADHILLKPDGTETKDITEATGIRYVAIERPDAPFTFMFDGATPGTALTMLGLFGAKTKATNEASRVRNGDGGGVDEQLDAIEEVFQQLTAGVWREKAEGGAGARIDRETVAEILSDLLAAGGTQVPAHVIAQRFADGYDHPKQGRQTGDQYWKAVWSNDAVKAEYRKRKGQTGAALDSLA